MKRVSYSVLLIFLLSCGVSSIEPRLVSVYSIYGETIDGYLLSVKDSTVEVELINTPTDTSNTRLKIPFTQINFIYLSNADIWNPVVGGCTAGCAAGWGVGLALSPKDPQGTLGRIFFTGIGMVIGAVTGGVVGCEIQNVSNTYYLYKAKDLEYLKTVAIEK